MANVIVGPSDSPPSSDDAAGMVAGAATIEAPRAVLRANGELRVGNPNGLTVNRLKENGANGLNTRGLATAEPGVPPDCAAAPSIRARPSASPAIGAKHLNIEVHLVRISKR
jgi:hypothetical protein